MGSDLPAGSSSKPAAPAAAAAAPASGPSSYRSPRVEDEEDDDDLDDLDDVLDSFNAPPKPTLGKRAQPDQSPASAAAPASSSLRPPAGAAAALGAGAGTGLGDLDDEDFEASLVEGMEALLRSLANEHPPGPAADGKKLDTPSKKAVDGAPGLSSEEEEKAFQRAIEMMLSNEGIEALGIDDKAKAGASAPSPRRAPASGGAAAGPSAARATSFEETIRKTMESINAGGANVGAGGDDTDLAALLRQLGSDPSALDGLGDEDDDLGGLLDGMMAQLMSKEVLEEPMAELAAKYPEYLAKPPSTATPADLEKYRQQHKLVQQIVETFKKPGYTDERDGKEVARLVGEMQDLGGPPTEIMGDLPEGFDFANLGNDEQCVIM
ncbi:Peroxisome biogenesis protein 19-1 [Vanrija pseudolonga]|uniref:Peroxisome biogenesis protein 19-1 n=1 Tax=Vanrija pseudolonga TaxID=143232 RepID=A0AAF0Y3D2_9TREE|nr:Peroxisome biogenesis protein 19-1 [Vanrija pseudolonga]